MNTEPEKEVGPVDTEAFSLAELEPHLLRTLAGHIQDGLFMITDERIVFINEAGARLLGYTTEQLLGAPFADTIAEPVREIVVSNYQRRIKGEPIEQKYRTKLLSRFGEAVPVELSVSVFRHKDGQVSTLGSFRDLTLEDKYAERANYAEREFQQLLANIPDVFYRTDGQGFITFVSPYCEEVIGYSADDLVGTQMADLYVRPDERRGVVAKLIDEDGKLIQVERALRHRDGSEVWVSTSGRATFDSEGNFLGVEGIARDITDRKRMEDQLRFMSEHDALTGLLNRQGIDTILRNAIRKCTKTHQHFALLFLDMDNFKTINDTHGHHQGDEVLKEFAKRLSKCFRASDVIARMGGDEFIVLLDPISHEEDVTTAVANLRREIQRPLEFGSETIMADVSIGAAVFPEDGITEDDLMKIADSRMYTNKLLHHGKGKDGDRRL